MVSLWGVKACSNQHCLSVQCLTRPAQQRKWNRDRNAAVNIFKKGRDENYPLSPHTNLNRAIEMLGAHE